MASRLIDVTEVATGRPAQLREIFNGYIETVDTLKTERLPTRVERVEMLDGRPIEVDFEGGNPRFVQKESGRVFVPNSLPR